MPARYHIPIQRVGKISLSKEFLDSMRGMPAIEKMAIAAKKIAAYVYGVDPAQLDQSNRKRTDALAHARFFALGLIYRLDPNIPDETLGNYLGRRRSNICYSRQRFEDIYHLYSDFRATFDSIFQQFKDICHSLSVTPDGDPLPLTL